MNWPEELLEIFPNKTWSAIQRTASKHNIKEVDWSDDEKKIVELYYPIEGGKVLDRLVGKTIHQLRAYVKRNNIKNRNVS